jgi:hypothetical protein
MAPPLFLFRLLSLPFPSAARPDRWMHRCPLDGCCGKGKVQFSWSCLIACSSWSCFCSEPRRPAICPPTLPRRPSFIIHCIAYLQVDDGCSKTAPMKGGSVAARCCVVGTCRVTIEALRIGYPCMVFNRPDQARSRDPASPPAVCQPMATLRLNLQNFARLYYSG